MSDNQNQQLDNNNNNQLEQYNLNINKNNTIQNEADSQNNNFLINQDNYNENNNYSRIQEQSDEDCITNHSQLNSIANYESNQHSIKNKPHQIVINRMKQNSQIAYSATNGSNLLQSSSNNDSSDDSSQENYPNTRIKQNSSVEMSSYGNNYKIQVDEILNDNELSEQDSNKEQKQKNQYQSPQKKSYRQKLKSIIKLSPLKRSSSIESPRKVNSRKKKNSKQQNEFKQNSNFISLFSAAQEQKQQNPNQNKEESEDDEYTKAQNEHLSRKGSVYIKMDKNKLSSILSSFGLKNIDTSTKSIADLVGQVYTDRLSKKTVDITEKENQDIVLMILQKTVKSQEEIEFLVKSIQSMKVFDKHRDILFKQNQKQINNIISQSLSYKGYKKHQVVFEQGEFGFEYFIVLRGSVWCLIQQPDIQNDGQDDDTSPTSSINRNKNLNSEQQYINKHFPKNKLVYTFKPGEGFGEIALINKDRRTATIVCKEDTEFMVMNKFGFENIVATGFQIDQEKKLEFAYKFPFFRGIYKAKVESFLYQYSPISFKQKSVIYKENDKSNYIYLIKSGEIEISIIQNKNLNEDNRENKLQDFQYLENLNCVKQMQNKKKNQERVKLFLQGEACYFGDLEIIKRSNKRISMATVSQAAEIYVIKKSKFILFLKMYENYETFIKESKNKNNYHLDRLQQMKEIKSEFQNEVSHKDLENLKYLNTKESEPNTKNQKTEIKSTQIKQNQQIDNSVTKKQSKKQIQQKLEELNLTQVVTRSAFHKQRRNKDQYVSKRHDIFQDNIPYNEDPMNILISLNKPQIMEYNKNAQKEISKIQLLKEYEENSSYSNRLLIQKIKQIQEFKDNQPDVKNMSNERPSLIDFTQFKSQLVNLKKQGVDLSKLGINQMPDKQNISQQNSQKTIKLESEIQIDQNFQQQNKINISNTNINSPQINKIQKSSQSYQNSKNNSPLQRKLQKLDPDGKQVKQIPQFYFEDQSKQENNSATKNMRNSTFFRKNYKTNNKTIRNSIYSLNNNTNNNSQTLNQSQKIEDYSQDKIMNNTQNKINNELEQINQDLEQNKYKEIQKFQQKCLRRSMIVKQQQKMTESLRKNRNTIILNTDIIKSRSVHVSKNSSPQQSNQQQIQTTRNISQDTLTNKNQTNYTNSLFNIIDSNNYYQQQNQNNNQSTQIHSSNNNNQSDNINNDNQQKLPNLKEYGVAAKYLKLQKIFDKNNKKNKKFQHYQIDKNDLQQFKQEQISKNVNSNSNLINNSIGNSIINNNSINNLDNTYLQKNNNNQQQQQQQHHRTQSLDILPNNDILFKTSLKYNFKEELKQYKRPYQQNTNNNINGTYSSLLQQQQQKLHSNINMQNLKEIRKQKLLLLGKQSINNISYQNQFNSHILHQAPNQNILNKINSSSNNNINKDTNVDYNNILKKKQNESQQLNKFQYQKKIQDVIEQQKQKSENISLDFYNNSIRQSCDNLATETDRGNFSRYKDETEKMIQQKKNQNKIIQKSLSQQNIKLNQQKQQQIKQQQQYLKQSSKGWSTTTVPQQGVNNSILNILNNMDEDDEEEIYYKYNKTNNNNNILNISQQQKQQLQQSIQINNQKLPLPKN